MTDARAVTIALVQTQTPTPGDEGGQGEDFGKSSPVGFVVLLLFFIAVAFLVRSMNKHLRRVPASFDEPAEPADSGRSGGDRPPDEPGAAPR